MERRLTADDINNKKFHTVKFHEGYNQAEVDEFLDEVVATVFALTTENEDLKAELKAAHKKNKKHKKH